jgi:hypothetical protein
VRLTWFAIPAWEVPYRDNAIQAGYKDSLFLKQMLRQSSAISRNLLKSVLLVLTHANSSCAALRAKSNWPEKFGEIIVKQQVAGLARVQRLGNK